MRSISPSDRARPKGYMKVFDGETLVIRDHIIIEEMEYVLIQ